MARTKTALRTRDVMEELYEVAARTMDAHRAALEAKTEVNGLHEGYVRESDRILGSVTAKEAKAFIPSTIGIMARWMAYADSMQGAVGVDLLLNRERFFALGAGKFTEKEMHAVWTALIDLVARGGDGSVLDWANFAADVVEDNIKKSSAPKEWVRRTP